MITKNFGGILVACCIALLSCNKAKTSATSSAPLPTERVEPAKPVPLTISDAAFKQMSNRFLQSLKTDVRVRCRRAVLFGEPRSEPGDAQMLAFLELSTPGLAACADDVSEENLSSLFLHYNEPPAGYPIRQIMYGKTISATPTDDAKKVIKELRKHCGNVGPTLRALVRHAEICTPYRTGKRHLVLLDRAQRVSRNFSFMQRLTSRANPLTALNGLFDGIRFSQDMQRGQAPFLLSLLSQGVSVFMVIAIEHILNTAPTSKLSALQLTGLAAAVTKLLRSEPAPALMLSGEAENMKLHQLISARSPNWTPPGGKPVDEIRRGPKAQHVGSWIVLDHLYQQLIKACHQQTAWSCLLRVRKTTTTLLADNVPQLDRLLKRAFSTADFRSKMKEIIQGNFVETVNTAMGKSFHRRFHLTAIAIHLAYRRLKHARQPISVARLKAAAAVIDAAISVPLIIVETKTRFHLKPAKKLDLDTKRPRLVYVIFK